MELIKDILEIIYYLCAPVLVVAAIYGLRQVKLATEQINETKETRKIQSKRESYSLAAEQCKYYMETIIPLLNEFDKLLEHNHFEFFEKTKVSIEANRITIQIYKDKDAVEKVINTCISEVNNLCNLLEGFSVYFISGLASENIAYETVGSSYIDSVKKLLPIVMLVEGHYDNTKKLFLTWHNRYEKMKLIKQKEFLEMQLKGRKEFVIDTIGTK